MPQYHTKPTKAAGSAWAQIQDYCMLLTAMVVAVHTACSTLMERNSLIIGNKDLLFSHAILQHVRYPGVISLDCGEISISTSTQICIHLKLVKGLERWLSA